MSKDNKNRQAYVLVICEDEDIKEKVKLPKGDYEKFNDRLIICVLYILEDREEKVKTVSNNRIKRRLKRDLMELLEKELKIQYINLYHSYKQDIESLFGESNYEILDKINRNVSEKKLKFSHEDNDIVYGAIKEIIKCIEQNNEDEMIRIIEERLLKELSKNLRKTNEDKLSVLIHKINQERHESLKEIVMEILNDKEFLEYFSKKIFEAIKDALDNENKQKLYILSNLLDNILKPSQGSKT